MGLVVSTQKSFGDIAVGISQMGSLVHGFAHQPPRHDANDEKEDENIAAHKTTIRLSFFILPGEIGSHIPTIEVGRFDSNCIHFEEQRKGEATQRYHE